MKLTRYDPATASRVTTARMTQAFNTARLSGMRQRHAAILTLGGSVIAVGINTKRNAIAQYIPYPAISNHAEINCLKGLGAARNCKLYVARLTPSGTLGDSRPCRECLAYINIYTDIKEIIHS